MGDLRKELMVLAEYEQELRIKILSYGSVYDENASRPYSYNELPFLICRLSDIRRLGTNNPL